LNVSLSTVSVKIDLILFVYNLYNVLVENCSIVRRISISIWFLKTFSL